MAYDQALLPEQICKPMVLHLDFDLILSLCQGNVVVANEFHRRYADQGLVSLSLHPGNLKFDTKRHPS